MSIDAKNENRQSKLLRANRVLENMLLTRTSSREATFLDDNGHRSPIVVDYSIWPEDVLLCFYVLNNYSALIYKKWYASVENIKKIDTKALHLIDIIDDLNEQNNKLQQGWDNEREDRDYR